MILIVCYKHNTVCIYMYDYLVFRIPPFLFDSNILLSLTVIIGTTPLHLAAKSGSLDSALLMVSNHGDMVSADNAGWAAIHHASFYNHAPIIRMFIRKFEDQMELETWDK